MFPPHFFVPFADIIPKTRTILPEFQTTSSIFCGHDFADVIVAKSFSGHQASSDTAITPETFL